MATAGYKHLNEELGSPSAADKPWNANLSETSLRDAAFSSQLSQYPSQMDNTEVDVENSVKSKSKSQKTSIWRLKSDSGKYKAMRPTAVKELNERDVEGDGANHNDTSSKAHLKLDNKKELTLSKIHVIICCLLISCVVLIAFTTIYVFIILPSNKGRVLYPDGKTHLNYESQNFGDNVVSTSCGLVRGTQEQGAYVFKGIPYALPPTGSRRWKAPVPRSPDTNTCWDGIYPAIAFSSKCVQPKFDNVSAIEGSEDCLYVNVWSPSLNPQTRLPVLVWFHSGDFVYGSGHMPGMSPSPEIAVATNSVYVSFNYRLGALGFLALDELRVGSRGPAGNYGFMDQQLVLMWVRDNIRQFGGDENMVTIFGHGSGATSVHAMLSSAGSSGLFHKAWLTGPVAVLNKTVDEACRDNSVFMQNTGCKDAHCLRQLTAEVISRSSPWPLQAQWTLDELFSIPQKSQLRNDLPIFDGHVVHWSSQKSGPDGPVVPVVFGSAYFDFSSLKTEAAVVNMTWKDYDDMMIHLVDLLGADAIKTAKSLYSDKDILKYISPSRFPSTPSAQFSHIIGDIKDICPVKILADDFIYLYSGSAPVYMYITELYPSQNMKFAGTEKETFIGWDIAAFFDSFQDLNLKVGQGEVNFQNVIRDEIMTFVRSSHPDASRWDTADVNVGIFSHDVTVTPVTSEYFHKCNLWKQNQFFKYRWNDG
ncbi:unnamed protein product [Candidula unifasciata]|uniref:Carboxylesterase type B domain-containing protein n=1 Tax=Candidula unifasciata TaxID=100452 RepID=A0A8S3Z4W1_9EUPU|nr:unnamed protein product [Candidula unifasciata]